MSIGLFNLKGKARGLNPKLVRIFSDQKQTEKSNEKPETKHKPEKPKLKPF